MDELDGSRGGFTEKAAADEEVAQDLRGVALPGGGREEGRTSATMRSARARSISARLLRISQ